MVALDLWVPHDSHPWLVAVLDAVLLTCAMSPALWFAVVRPLRRLFELRGRLLAGVFASQEQERARLARDLHDELGQHLTAILVSLRTVEQAHDLQQARERCRVVSEMGTACINEVRRLARGLRPTVLEDLGLAPALERLCEEFAVAHRLQLELSTDSTKGKRFNPAIEVCVYRVVQEALTNVARYAAAKIVTVKLIRTEQGLELAIHDDGRGFDVGARTRQSGSLGLVSMRERITLLGGRFVLFSRPGEGTTVQASIPCGEIIDE